MSNTTAVIDTTAIEADFIAISQSSKALSALADQANAKIKALDAFFADANLGLEVWGSTIKEGSEPATDCSGDPILNADDEVCMVDFHIQIGYGKDDDGQWGLVARKMSLQFDGEVNDYALQGVWIRKLSATQRDIRIAALKELPSLVSLVAKQAQEAVEKLKEDVTTAGESVSEGLLWHGRMRPTGK